MGKIVTLPDCSLVDITRHQEQIMQALEEGLVVFFPRSFFRLMPEDMILLDPKAFHLSQAKNISYRPITQEIKGCDNPTLQPALQALMQRYAEFARQMVDHGTPHYRRTVKMGRTSFRPAEIAGRETSKLKDDTRLHVDAFSATPVYGQRLLRVFTNINPDNQARRWLLGEPFINVAERFIPQAPSYSAFKAKVMHKLRLTKSVRTPYDHYMLHLHNSMKLDVDYQQQVEKEQFDFPAGSCWMVYTDQVSHAALSGQFLLEQTFYLSPGDMLNPASSPLHILEKMTRQLLL